jgi:hypothetical protein
MSKYFVIVAGNGATSRANIEALMEDYYYAGGDGGTLLLPYTEKPSQGQVFAAQYSKDNGKDIVIFAPEGATYDSIPSSSVVLTTEPFAAAADEAKGNNPSAFILWADEDNDSQVILTYCRDANIPCFDLTNGLGPLTATEDAVPITTPVVPKQEQVTQPVVEEEEDDEEEEGDEEEYEEDEEEMEDLDGLYEGVEAVARIFAKVLIEEWKKANETPKP